MTIIYFVIFKVDFDVAATARTIGEESRAMMQMMNEEEERKEYSYNGMTMC